MRSLIRSSIFFLLMGCVPNGADPDPRGGVALQTAPSSATRGEPFTTSDGWTIRISKLAAISVVVAQTPGSDEPSEERFLWDATVAKALIVRAVPTGKATVFTGLQSAGRRFDGNGVEVEPFVNLDVDAETERRVRVDGGPGPSLFLAATAEKDGQLRQIRVLLVSPVERPDAPESPRVEVTVKQDDVVYAPLEVHAEALLDRAQPILDLADANGEVPTHTLMMNGFLALKP